MHECGAALLVRGGDGKGTVKRKREGGVRKGGGREKERGEIEKESVQRKTRGRGGGRSCGYSILAPFDPHLLTTQCTCGARCMYCVYDRPINGDNDERTRSLCMTRAWTMTTLGRRRSGLACFVWESGRTKVCSNTGTIIIVQQQ